MILVRADASPQIGLGHAMRCLALAQAYRDAGGEVVFAMDAPPKPFAARLAREGCGLRDAAETEALARDADWVVLDGYHFDAGYERTLRAAGRLLVLDDHDADHDADLILRQGLGARAGDRVLAGPRYALLRREFRTWDAPPCDVPERVRRILVTLGGGDPGPIVDTVLAAVSGEHRAVQWITGPLNPRRDAPPGVEVVVDAADMPERMHWADLAVTAAGSTSWELARVGTPQIAIELADNQRPVARALEQHGIAVRAGWHADLDGQALAAAIDGLTAERRTEMTRRGRATIDGLGAVRVLEAMGLGTTMPPDADPVRPPVPRRR
ncbi:MAG TPA: UDP-2,4-diacetamido-2,4,6-trideoxy-beta-L-altropyranose hydrolase [Solirubrobacteraceae bacterium]|nr:UDP-2,4-diacetamido-2,4,6-trideoxy-beta-L-altropyranose hydrolase [Solirubrobacteraceae bacterium]